MLDARISVAINARWSPCDEYVAWDMLVVRERRNRLVCSRANAGLFFSCSLMMMGLHAKSHVRETGLDYLSESDNSIERGGCDT